MVFEYSFDIRSPFYEASSRILSRFYGGPHTLIVSVFLRGELLIIPTRRQDAFATARVNKMLGPAFAIQADFGEIPLRQFVSLRANHAVRPMDALHLSIAATVGTDFFITNDHKLLKLTVPGIGRIIGLEDAPATLVTASPY